MASGDIHRPRFDELYLGPKLSKPLSLSRSLPVNLQIVVTERRHYTAAFASKKAALKKPARTYHHFEVIRAATTPATTAQGNTTRIIISHTRGTQSGGTTDGPTQMPAQETRSATRPAMPMIFPLPAFAIRTPHCFTTSCQKWSHICVP